MVVSIDSDYIFTIIFFIRGHWYDLQNLRHPSSDIFSEFTMLERHREFINHSEHIGVILNTDGVSVFKSSRVSIWPVFPQIANLPFKILFLPSNIVTCGIWVGQQTCIHFCLPYYITWISFILMVSHSSALKEIKLFE